MKIAVIGSRTFQNKALLYKELDVYEGCISLIVSGGAMGADSLAEVYAQEKEIPIKIFRPDYEQYSKKAPLIRNEQIIRSGDFIIAFWDGESTGTAHAINIVRKLGKCFRIVYYKA